MILVVLGSLIFAAIAAAKGDDILEEVEVHLDSWTRFDDLFKKYGPPNGVDWKNLKAIALNESDLGRAKSVALGMLDPMNIEGSKSSDGLSWGLMQVTLKTARGLDSSATEEKLNNPEYSVRLASIYLKQLQGMFNPLETRYREWVIKSYNQGPGNTRKERAGEIAGYAQEYWNRFQRNRLRVEDNQ